MVAGGLLEIVYRSGAVQIEQLAACLPLDSAKPCNQYIVEKLSGIGALERFDHGLNGMTRCVICQADALLACSAHACAWLNECRKMLPQILGIDEGHAMHRAEPFGLLYVYVCNAEDEVSGFNIQAFAQ
jgi:hypothetical protein